MKAALSFLPRLTTTVLRMRRLGLGLVVLMTAFATVLPAAQAADRDDRGSVRQERRDDDHQAGPGEQGGRASDKDQAREKERNDDRDRAKVQVSLTAPVTGTIVTAPATITLTAAAQSSQKNHPVTHVEFYQGATLIGTATTAPYTVTWSAIPAGSYRLTAKAYTDKADQREARGKEKDKDKAKDEKAKDVAVSAPVDILVNAPPVVVLTSPSANQVANAPGSVTMTANAMDSDGTIAQVEFYNGATLIGSATAAPYTITWSNVPAGTYSLTARATDNHGASTTTIALPVIVNALPVVSLGTSGAPYVAPANATLTATAADSDGTIAKVEFYNGTTLVGTATSAPYAVSLTALAAGTYSLTAKATDNQGGARTSPAVTLTVAPNQLPTITLTSPAPNQIVVAPATLTVTANATDSDGTIAKVAFYQGSTLIGTATTAPYSITWSNVPAGSYSLTAVATDDKGGITTSAAVSVTVNALPVVTLTSPNPDQMVNAPGSFTLTANATDSDGMIAKVEFYQGATLIGTATTAPYTVTWNNVPAGTYSLTVRATDNLGGSTTSSPVSVIVNALPTVSLTSPTANAIIAAPASVTVTANASDTDGSIAKVDFYQGATLIGTATTAPYSITWSNVPSGSYSLTATATDNLGGQESSTPVPITVDAPPTVALTSPSAGSVGIAPANFTLTANAADSDGTIAKVEFYSGTTPIGTTTTAPYTLSWNAVSPGNYSLTAIATDNLGLQTTSVPITISVIANSPPTISLTSPTQNQSFKAPASITLTANASDPDNNLAKVEFVQNGTLIATVLSPPYTATWSNVAQGSYQITAVATDAVGAQTMSDPVTITVTPAQASLYFIHPDHLGTPRLVTDETNTIVWRHLPTTEPFGNTPPEEDPQAAGRRFEMPLAFPGQYRDRESNLNYNFFRDYDPGRGRYVQSDPIGLAGGINTYSYVNGNPISRIDPLGLDSYLVNRSLQAVQVFGFDVSASSRLNPLTHTLVAITNPDGSVATTYSWGNEANMRGWNVNQPLDLSAAAEAIQKGRAERVGGTDLDPFVAQAFGLVNSEPQHSNGVVTFNCKLEADHLLYKAKQLYRQSTRSGPIVDGFPIRPKY
ncbi:MAG: Ig-like domain-containing protein [Sulfuritalea sp.]|nr:Ig-like domain-containing protein [Sulfuritalea sp.]